MKPEQACIIFDMRVWTIDRRSVILLMGFLIVITLVLVLPQVDLLDTAFHLGTSPILIHSQGTAKPAFLVLSGIFIFPLFATDVADQRSEDQLLIMGIHEVQIFNHCFRL